MEVCRDLLAFGASFKWSLGELQFWALLCWLQVSALELLLGSYASVQGIWVRMWTCRLLIKEDVCQLDRETFSPYVISRSSSCRQKVVLINLQPLIRFWGLPSALNHLQGASQWPQTQFTWKLFRWKHCKTQTLCRSELLWLAAPSRRFVSVVALHRSSALGARPLALCFPLCFPLVPPGWKCVLNFDESTSRLPLNTHTRPRQPLVFSHIISSNFLFSQHELFVQAETDILLFLRYKTSDIKKHMKWNWQLFLQQSKVTNDQLMILIDWFLMLLLQRVRPKLWLKKDRRRTITTSVSTAVLLHQAVKYLCVTVWHFFSRSQR